MTLIDGWKRETNLVLWLVYTRTCRSSGVEKIKISQSFALTAHPALQVVVLRRCQELHRMEIRVRLITSEIIS